MPARKHRTEKRTRARTVRITVLLTPEEESRIFDWLERPEHDNLTFSDAVRSLIEQGLSLTKTEE